MSREAFEQIVDQHRRDNRERFETKEVVRVRGRDEFGEGSEKVRISDAQLIEMGLAPRPRRVDLPSGVGSLPKLAELGVELPPGVADLIDRLQTIDKTYRDLTKRISRKQEALEANDREARKDRVRQLAQGVSPDQLKPYVPKDDEEPFSLAELRELQENAISARDLVSRELADRTRQEEFFPALSQAYFDSFVPDDFEGSKVQIEAAEKRGKAVRNAVLKYQTEVGFYQDERGARNEYLKLCEKLGGPVQLDDFVAYRGGELTLAQIRVRPDDPEPNPVSPADLKIVLEDEEDAA